VEFAEVLPGETEAGEKEQLAPAGSPDAHVRATDEPKFPPDAVTETVKTAEFPALTVKLEGERLIEKSTPVPLSEAVCGLPFSESSAIVSMPVCAPIDVGVKVMLSVQLEPEAREVPQLLVCE
jgi:hypothetical protein